MIGETESIAKAKLVYWLYLAGLVTVCLTSMAGVVIAYIYRSTSSPLATSHFDFQIRTFWTGFLMLLVGYVLSFVLIGYLIYFFLFFWWIVRCVRGIRALELSFGVSQNTVIN